MSSNNIEVALKLITARLHAIELAFLERFPEDKEKLTEYLIDGICNLSRPEAKPDATIEPLTGMMD